MPQQNFATSGTKNIYISFCVITLQTDKQPRTIHFQNSRDTFRENTDRHKRQSSLFLLQRTICLGLKLKVYKKS